MLELRKVNYEDWQAEFEAIRKIPANENGFENKYSEVSEDEFKNKVIPHLLANSEGRELRNGFVANTYFFLWDDNKIVGLFKIRHYLNDFLAKGPGHMGYAILSEYRGKGYATKGIELAMEKCRELVKEDEVYMCVHKNNVASLRAQLKNGAYIVEENEEEIFTRIKK